MSEMKITFKVNPEWKKFLGEVHDKSFKVGVLKSNTDKALAHEFGAPAKKVPARPFLRPSLLNRKNVITAVQEGFRLKSVNAIGDHLAGEVRAYLNDMYAGKKWKGNTVAALAPATIKKRGEEDPQILYDTGALKQAISSEVE